jgi:hypothetical protein
LRAESNSRIQAHFQQSKYTPHNHEMCIMADNILNLD